MFFYVAKTIVLGIERVPQNSFKVYLAKPQNASNYLNFMRIHVIILIKQQIINDECKMENMIITLLKATFKIITDVSLPIYIGILLSNLSRRGMFEGLAQNSLGRVAAFLQMPRECAMAIMLSLGDRMAGMGMLMVAKHKNLINDQQIVAVNLISKLPSVIQFFVVSFVPIIINLFPRDIAVEFLVLYLLAFTIISWCGFIYLRFINKIQIAYPEISPLPKKIERSWQVVWLSAKESLPPCLRSLSILGTMTFAALFFSRYGALDILGKFLPVDANLLPIAMVGMLSMLAGIMAVGAELQAGTIDIQIVLPLLFAISILHNIYDLFTNSIPRTFAVFGSSLGIKVALSSFVVTQTVMLIMMLIVM